MSSTATVPSRRSVTEMPTRGDLSEFISAHGERLVASHVKQSQQKGLLRITPMEKTDEDGRIQRTFKLQGSAEVLSVMSALDGIGMAAKKHRQDWINTVRSYNESQAHLESALQEAGVDEKRRDALLDNIGYSVLHPMDAGVEAVKKLISTRCTSESGSRASEFLSNLQSFMGKGSRILTHSMVITGRTDPGEILTGASKITKAKASVRNSKGSQARAIGLYRTNDDHTESSTVKKYSRMPSMGFVLQQRTAPLSKAAKSALGYWPSSSSACRSSKVPSDAPYYPSAPSISGSNGGGLGYSPSAPSLNAVATTGQATPLDYYPSAPSIRRPSPDCFSEELNKGISPSTASDGSWDTVSEAPSSPALTEVWMGKAEGVVSSATNGPVIEDGSWHPAWRPE
ncbi:hypothetical protein L198_06735 [Cryptococcus wingfieldii CBS 7118]|uniref:Uncharacterized protein n=1 Tax=Cryptococcus wingfieldii CBS 7118 TaxID=1295528 RepID=A0A1E3IIP8_9TREE|nr:hypothetical protein L198_06735 [Cryptococcus wingfieldii CBS 7118]ODN88463.1 hypothetical protein L198_06735 [Cryptococcus wingfieldii CBS 7118]